VAAIPTASHSYHRLASMPASHAAWSGLLCGDLDAARGWLDQLSDHDLIAVRLAASLACHLAEQTLARRGATAGTSGATVPP
jgi:hypothetical protein